MQETDLLASRVLKTENIAWTMLKPLQHEGFKELTPAAHDKLRWSILQNQFTQPFYVWHDERDGVVYCLDGIHRLKILAELKEEGFRMPIALPATFIACENKQEAAKLVLIYSSMYAKVTEGGFLDFMSLHGLDFDSLKLEVDLPELDMIEVQSLFTPDDRTNAVIPQSLLERFIVPPFSVLDSRQGYWQDRKKKWSALFDSQETREDIELIAKSGQGTAVYELRNKMREALGRDPSWDEIIEHAKKKGIYVFEGASIFDPVLCEILYHWFTFPGAKILDPFAGGSVRGLVAGIMGLNYYGIDLREEQVHANLKQRQKLHDQMKGTVAWNIGDSQTVVSEITDAFDFVFSCPPYHDLEKYSDDPADLSNMKYEAFHAAYETIIIKSLKKLKDNRFACFVVSEIRDKEGFYKGFVQDTINAFQRDSDCRLYNEIILLNVAGSMPIRVGRQFQVSRKVGKTHQNVLVFYKGDPKKIREIFPEIKTEEVLDNREYQPNLAMSVVD